MNRRALTISSACAGLALCAIPAAAQEAGDPEANKPGDSIEIGSEMGGFEGVRQVNVAAGNGNQQVNLAVVAAGETAIGSAEIVQINDQPAPAEARGYSALITGEAFAGSRGLTAVNVAAGSGNSQANLAMIVTGLEGRVASLATLEQARASSEPQGAGGENPASDFEAKIDRSAFRDSSGIVQVSLVGGTGNASANVAVLSMEAGTNRNQ
ncbi:hypothetical protein [Erythrobacter sp. THAF29]|uniref:hypothetical protein n=1 Tax=Erythrobacter sp. THAF29 TaxID=2587851 RepID=UPI0012694EBB|nr:hypothetical protein [Erythrobacter sp. THAF29]QFT76458.1 hypothetical protein FIU90_02770 [Erythrobacter sp. THAF29]